MIFAQFVQKNASEFRGAARGVSMSRTFCDLPKFSQIISALAQTCLICDNLHHTCKKDLTRDPVAGILAQGKLHRRRTTTCWRRRLALFILFAPNVKKRLDKFRSSTYTGARPTTVSSSHYYSGAPAPKSLKSQALLSQKEIEGGRPDGDISSYGVDQIYQSGNFCEFHNAYPLSSGFSSGVGQP